VAEGGTWCAEPEPLGWGFLLFPLDRLEDVVVGWQLRAVSGLGNLG
jgi:hypothetical protein